MELSILDNLCPKLPRTPSVLFNDSVSSLLAYNKTDMPDSKRVIPLQT